MRRAAWLVLLLELAGCRRVTAPSAGAELPVRNVTVAFPGDQRGELFFEVVLPPGVPAVAALRWELWLSGRRFAEGVVRAPTTTADAADVRVVRIEAPLSWRHLGWRDGPTFLDVGVRGEVTPVDAPEGLRLPFRARAQVLVTGAPTPEDDLAGPTPP
ncbi:MAG: hypothetical protein INH41_19475 [Myxococcaceae bacterium]|nr:hypothetical protein [Myxococcaceae bacterium]MCA3014569.1 hypothetical protein [Myxococcaceae bacterium]